MINTSPAGITSLGNDILLFEEDERQLEKRRDVLEDAQCSVVSATSLPDVLRIPRERPFCLILLGIARLAITREVATLARERWPSARILLVGMADPLLEDHLYDDTVSDPLDPGELPAALLQPLQHAWSKWPITKTEGGLEKGPLQILRRDSGAPESDPTKMSGVDRMTFAVPLWPPDRFCQSAPPIGQPSRSRT